VPYDLLFGQRKAPDGTPLTRSPDGGRKIVDVYARLPSAVPQPPLDDAPQAGPGGEVQEDDRVSGFEADRQIGQPIRPKLRRRVASI